MTTNVSVKLSSGRTARFPVTSATTVGDLCSKVADEDKNPAEIVTLKFDGKVLKRSKRLICDYGVREEMVLRIKLLTKKALKVHLNLPGNEVVSVDIHNTSPLPDIRDQLYQAKPYLMGRAVDFKIGQMSLNFSNYAYEDCLEDGETIEVKLKPLAGEEVEEQMEEEDRQDVLNSFASSMTSLRRVDIVFSFDTTGSMFSLLEIVRGKLRYSVQKLMVDIPNIQIGIMAHGDFCDEHLYVLRKHDISGNTTDLVDFVNATQGSGGEGNYACYEWVLRQANGLSWREDSAKALVIIGDVVPHPTSYTNLRINWRDELDELCAKGVKVYGVQARDFEPANSFYGFMARKSGGAHIKFQHFNLITDMFLAVCYRESGDSQLQAYVDEVRNEGRMTEEMMAVMDQLEKKDEDEEEEKEEKEEEEGATNGASASASAAENDAEPARRRAQEEPYINEAWWDPSLDNGNQRFTYDETRNVWSRDAARAQPSSYLTTNNQNAPTRGRSTMRKLKMKKGCALM